jgi:UDP-N-acetylmuramyl pentapeptide synthase
VSSALRFLQQIGRNRVKIAVIGDMNELGHSAKQAHKDLADNLPRYCDRVILFGPLTKAHTLPVLLAKHFPVMHFGSMPALVKYLSSSITPKSVVLVKGSQNQLYLERAVASILKDPKDLKYLCRRGKYWDHLRRQAP